MARHRMVIAVALVAVGLALAVAGAGRLSAPPELSIPAPASTAAPPRSSPTTPTPPIDLAALGRDAAANLPVGIDPVRIEIPAIGVDAPLVRLGMTSPTEIEVPDTAHEAGWFTPSRRPGEIGPAIIAGHVDLDKGPAVFYRLRVLEPGHPVTVHGSDGATRTFEVVALGQYPKDALPDEVFGFGAPVPELRLITCGGVFDRATGHYRDNVVVYARLVGA